LRQTPNQSADQFITVLRKKVALEQADKKNKSICGTEFSATGDIGVRIRTLSVNVV
jgi:hypothetical protein